MCRPSVLKLVAFAVLLEALAGCGTLVRVVDDAGTPVRSAAVRLVYPSFAGEAAPTDEQGWVRLAAG